MKAKLNIICIFVYIFTSQVSYQAFYFFAVSEGVWMMWIRQSSSLTVTQIMNLSIRGRHLLQINPSCSVNHVYSVKTILTVFYFWTGVKDAVLCLTAVSQLWLCVHTKPTELVLSSIFYTQKLLRPRRKVCESETPALHFRRTGQ